jgi:hypothetical protein
MDIRIQDRIKEIRKIKASELQPHSRNWRLHPKMQEKAMRGVLSDIGAADVLKAYYAEDGKLTLLDGHLRREVAPDFEWTVAILDFNEAEATEYLLTYDPLSAMAEADKEKLDGLLREIQTGDAAVQEMLAEMAEKAGVVPVSADEWGDAFGKIPDEDRAPFQQMTFTLHDSQAEIVKDALKKAKDEGDFSGSPNENSNGNALAYICEEFLNNGRS